MAGERRDALLAAQASLADADLRHVLASRHGRRFLRNIIEASRACIPEHKTDYDQGRSSFGIDLLNAIRRADRGAHDTLEDDPTWLAEAAHALGMTEDEAKAEIEALSP